MKTQQMKNSKLRKFFGRSLLSIAITAYSFPGFVMANPSGANVVHGSASIDSSTPGITNITNSPNSIINWQNFSIQQNEITRFIQQNSQSAVLNRVIGANPSQIMGQLLSNGQVFLINPNGIVFGQNSIVDTAGFLASTLNISNEDFLSGNYHFIAGDDAGDLTNQGIIRTGENGNIVLIAPNIENSGIVSTDGGQITLAAGESLTITSLDNPSIRFEIQAPDNSILNIGDVLANGGAAGLFAGTITHSGMISANSAEVDEQGHIRLVASDTLMLTENSVTTADNSAGKGGSIHLLGDKVGLVDQSSVSADGKTGGGEVLIGGDYQGKNPEVSNATATYVGQEVSVSADAAEQGDGGKVIVWSDELTRMYGDATATAGKQSGDGGFVEVSSKGKLDFQGSVDTSAIAGEDGTLLLDPTDINIVASDTATPDTNQGGQLFEDNTGVSTSEITIATLTNALSNGNVVISTNNDDPGATGVGNINWLVGANLDYNGLATKTLTLNADNNITIGGTIFDSVVGEDKLNLVLNALGAGGILISGNVNTGGGTVTANSTLTVAGTLASSTINGTSLLLNRGRLDNVTIGSDLSLTGGGFIDNNLFLADGVSFDSNNSVLFFTNAAAQIGLAAGATSATMLRSGSVMYANAGNNSGNVRIGDGITLQGSGVLSRYYTGGGWVNDGTILIDGAGSSSTFNSTNFFNYGLINVVEGNLDISTVSFVNSGSVLYAAGTTGAVNPDDFNNAGGSIEFGGDVFFLQPGASYSNTGTMSFTNGNVSIGGVFPVSEFTNPGNTRSGATVITLASGYWDLAGATLDLDTGIFGGALDSIQLATLANGTITGTNLISNGAFLDNITIGSDLALNGTLWIDNDLFLSDGVDFDISDESVFFSNASANIALAIGATAASMTLSGGELLANGDDNNGSVTIGSGVTIQGTGDISQYFANGGWINNGTVLADAAGTLMIDSDAFSNAGVLRASNGGILNTYGGFAVNNGGIVIDAGSVLNTNGNDLLNNTGALIEGAGTLSLVGATLTNAGTVSPGVGVDSTAVLTIDGNYVQSSTGLLEIELNGANPGSGHDQLSVFGTADLDGAVHVAQVSGYDPADGDSYRIIDAGNSVTGVFASETQPADFDALNPNGYGPDDVDMRYTAPQPPVEPPAPEDPLPPPPADDPPPPPPPAGEPPVEEAPVEEPPVEEPPAEEPPAEEPPAEEPQQVNEVVQLTELYTTETTVIEPEPEPVDEVAAFEELLAEEPTAAGSLEPVVDLTETDLDNPPPTTGTASGLALPEVEETGLTESIQTVESGGYTITDKSTFYSSLNEQEVVEGLKQDGYDELAEFYEKTAAGEETDEAQLVAVLENENISDEQRSSYLGIFARMRHIGMSKLLKGALDELKKDPDAADVFDDGETGPIEIVLDSDNISTSDGLARITGKIVSKSNMLYLGIDGKWVFVEPDGGFDTTIAVKKGQSSLSLEARDVAGFSDSAKVTVNSAIEGKEPQVKGRRVALFIAIEEYDFAIPELDTPVNDAHSVAARMAEAQGFETQIIKNPTKQEIIDELIRLSRELNEHDSLMVYYAGHGYQMEETGRGYWLPRDAQPTDPKNWVSNRDIARLFHRTRARQILLISDSCYSGAFARGQAPVENMSADDVRMLRAVMAMSSGGEQPVWDGGGNGHSIFADKLLDSISKSQIKGLPFYQMVRNKVIMIAPQEPGYGAMMLPGYDENADYVLKPVI